jgi:hypothetical protein
MIVNAYLTILTVHWQSLSLLFVIAGLISWESRCDVMGLLHCTFVRATSLFIPCRSVG